MRNRNDKPLSHRQTIQYECYDRLVYPCEASAVLAELVMQRILPDILGLGWESLVPFCEFDLIRSRQNVLLIPIAPSEMILLSLLLSDSV